MQSVETKQEWTLLHTGMADAVYGMTHKANKLSIVSWPLNVCCIHIPVLCVLVSRRFYYKVNDVAGWRAGWQTH